MDYDRKMKNRVSRIEGQLRGILRMMEEGQSCKEVVAQLSAVRNASDKAIAQIVAENLHLCILAEQAEGKQNTEKMVKEAIALLVKSY